MGAVGPMTGVPVASPATGPMSGPSSSILSPGCHSPGPQGSVAPSPTLRSANVPSPGSALNTPGWLLSVFYFS